MPTACFPPTAFACRMASNGRDGLPVDRDRPAVLEPHGHGLGFVRGVLRENAHPGGDEPRRGVEVFELAGLVGQPQEIGVGAVRCPLAHLDRELAALAVVDHLGPAAELAQEGRVAPRGVHPELGGEHVGTQLEPHLVVAATRRPVPQDRDAPLLHLGHHPGDDDVPADPGRVPVRAFVPGLEPEDFDAGFGDHVVERDGDVVRRPARPHPGLDRPEVGLVRLGDVGGQADDVHPVLGQPLGDGTRIQPAGRGERDGLALQVGDGGHGKFRWGGRRVVPYSMNNPRRGLAPRMPGEPRPSGRGLTTSPAP